MRLNDREEGDTTVELYLTLKLDGKQMCCFFPAPEISTEFKKC